MDETENKKSSTRDAVIFKLDYDAQIKQVLRKGQTEVDLVEGLLEEPLKNIIDEIDGEITGRPDGET